MSGGGNQRQVKFSTSGVGRLSVRFPFFLK